MKCTFCITNVGVKARWYKKKIWFICNECWRNIKRR